MRFNESIWAPPKTCFARLIHQRFHTVKLVDDVVSLPAYSVTPPCGS